MLHRRSFKLVLTFCAVAFVAAAPTLVDAASKKGRSKPAARTPALPLEETAESYLLVDASDGTVLAANNAHEALVPASLTKVMTLRLAFAAIRSGKISLHDKVTPSVRAWGGRRPLKGTSIMFLQPGHEVTVDQLLQGAAVASANDACVALAEQISGSLPAFVAEMNEEAKRLGLETAEFHDPHGLSLENRISAADMARLALAMLRDYPEYLSYASQPMMSYKGIKQYNHLRLLKTVDGVDGFKTGYLSQVGYNVVVTAMRGDRRLLAVVMGTPRRVNGRNGAPVRDRLAAKLLNTGFGEMTFASTNDL